VRAPEAANRASTDTGSVEGGELGVRRVAAKSCLHRHRVGGGRSLCKTTIGRNLELSRLNGTRDHPVR